MNRLHRASLPERPPGPKLPTSVQTALWARAPHRFNQMCHRRFGDIFTVRMLGFGEIVYVANANLAHDVLFSDRDVFQASEANRPIDFVVGGRSLLRLDGEDHKAMRRRLAPPFNGSVLGRYEHQIEEIVDAELSTWHAGDVVRLQPRLQTITLELMMRIVLGVQDERRRQDLRALVPELLHLNPLLILFPTLRRNIANIGPWARFEAVRTRVDDILHDEINQRHRAQGAPEGDILSTLIASDTKHALSDHEIRDHLVTLLVVGHETTAIAMGWLFERVLRHPEVKARLQTELTDNAAGVYPPYLEAVINEALRVRPVTLDVARTVNEPVDLDRYAIPAGRMIVVSLGLLNLCPETFPEPTCFRPERFLGLERPPAGFLPFGGGAHRCLGARFAMAEMRAIVSRILSRVCLEPVRKPGEQRRAIGPMIVPARGAEAVVARFT